MAQHSHVPKFGNWDDNGNIPYTVYFENARKDKGGVKIMNPNDPEENPEAFMSMREGLEINAVHANSNNSVSSLEKPHEIKGRHSRPPAHPRNSSSSNQQKRGSHRSITSESASDRSGSDYSLMQPGHRRGMSDMKKKKKNSSDGSNSFSTSVAGHARERTGSYSSAAQTHHRVASVPKFGAWDELDPKSGEGFTVIFNKVKEEKQIAASQIAAMRPTQSSYFSNAAHGQGHGRSSSRSKICCCLFSSGSE